VSTLTLLSLVFILIMLIFFSMKISRLNEDLKRLAQELALRTCPVPGEGGGEQNPEAGSGSPAPPGADP
jgi:hypothetical protein